VTHADAGSVIEDASPSSTAGDTGGAAGERAERLSARDHCALK
jgi:hypothetical protein